MVLAPDQLKEIHAQIRKRFTSHPVISVAPIKGDPPDQYSITYAMRGIAKNEAGEIIEADNHTIELTIPFGFPHFPPSCKPKSNVYHPDFDPGAVCVGEFWEEHQDIIELIIYLGQLINGEIYSTTNVFNEEALNWYRQKAADFPLTQIDWNTVLELEEDEEDSDKEMNFDSIDEDISAAIDFLSSDEDVETTEFGNSETSLDATAVDQISELGALQHLHDKKLYYELLRKVRGKSHLSNDVNMLSQLARSEIDQAEEIYNRGKKAEGEGRAGYALSCYEKVVRLVADFPSIEADINRVNQTLQLLDNLSGDVEGDQGDPFIAARETKKGIRIVY